MPRAFYLVLGVQFLSTLADNAFLIVAIARVLELSGPGWLIPLLKISFTLFYVVLAPFVGPLADAFPKGRVMLLANALKVVAMVWLLCGGNPVLAIGLAGLGSAIYAPAKYGLITELLPARDLVRANGFFESVTVCAVIFGTVLGGLLVSPLMPRLAMPFPSLTLLVQPTALVAGMLVLLVMNAVAMLLSAAVVDSGARYDPHSIHPAQLIKRFVAENRVLWRDALGGLSMSVTTLLWGVGATLQLMVLRWAHEALGLPLAQAAYLQGITALGVVAGAILASRWVELTQAERLLPVGIVMGMLVPLLLCVHSAWTAALLLVLVGALAGFFVVPMNALLQHRGCTLLTAGRSIAVQGFNENAGMLLMLGVYAVAIAVEVPLHALVWGFAVMVTGGMVLIWWGRNRSLHRLPSRPMTR
ncbi:lysophospholipid transporter LplT [Rhodoferax sp. GW822-FHT02A01]|uniref:lysophospholipid transporter LplT n=1 Tax=Rhodoferax sp. GW822-FHT02A01 TaxID=3141537 RepID=UPI00315D30A7